nr:hypothetical protein [Rodentibacter rarus]
MFSEALIDFIGEVSYDPVYGARPLKRAIQQEIENPLAQQIPNIKSVVIFELS